MRIILDTGALFYPRALQAIDPSVPVVVPAVVFLERSRQLAREGRMVPAEYRRLLRDSVWLVEPFGEEEALRTPGTRLDDAQWRRLARDAMIAGHVRPGDRLWTSNPRDFATLGVPTEQIVDVHELR